MARAALKRKPQVVFQSIEGPTSERIRHAHGFFELGGEDRASQKFTMLDSPLDRMKARNAIDPKEYSALRKYAHHWYHGGLQGSVSSMDLNRIFASDPLSMSGMAKSEGQAHHRQQYRDARALLDKAGPKIGELFGSKFEAKTFGHKIGIVVDNVVCHENSLEVAGYSIGYTSAFRAKEAAGRVICAVGRALAKHWGM